jgi:hypothetical protein
MPLQYELRLHQLLQSNRHDKGVLNDARHLLAHLLSGKRDIALTLQSAPTALPLLFLTSARR